MRAIDIINAIDEDSEVAQGYRKTIATQDAEIARLKAVVGAVGIAFDKAEDDPSEAWDMIREALANEEEPIVCEPCAGTGMGDGDARYRRSRKCDGTGESIEKEAGPCEK